MKTSSTFVFDNDRKVTFTLCEAICPETGEMQQGIFVHDHNDIYRDGDCIAFDVIPDWLPSSVDEAEDFLKFDCTNAVSDDSVIKTARFM